MTTIPTWASHTAGHNTQTGDVGQHCASWRRPTSPNTPAVQHVGDRSIRNLAIGSSGTAARSDGWAKTYMAIDWRWLTTSAVSGQVAWPNDGTPGHSGGFLFNFHNLSWDNGNTGSGGLGWGFGNPTSSVAFAINPIINSMIVHIENNGPTWETDISLPPANTWQSFFTEITWGRRTGEYSTGSGSINGATLTSLFGSAVGRIRVWQNGTLTLDSNTFFPAGINTLNAGRNPANNIAYGQSLCDFYQGSIYTNSWNVTGEGVVEATAARFGSTAAACLADTSITFNTNDDLPTHYDSTQGAAAANGNGGNSWIETLTPRDISTFIIPAEFSTGGPTNPPVNSVAPAVAGTTSSGQTLTCSTGTWSNTPTGYSYQWLYWNGVAWTTLGTNQSTYVLTSSEIGTKIRCDVTASNAGGAGPTTSSATTGIVDDGAGNYVGQGTMETGIVGWGANQGTELLTQDATEHHSGTKSLKCVTNGAGTFRGAWWQNGVVVNPGDQQRLDMWIKAASGTVRVAQVFRDSNATVLASSELTKTAGSVDWPTNTWVLFDLSDPAVAPAGTTYKTFSITTGSTSQDLTFYVDDVSLIAYVPPVPVPPSGDTSSRTAGTRNTGISRSVGGTRRAGEGGNV